MAKKAVAAESFALILKPSQGLQKKPSGHAETNTGKSDIYPRLSCLQPRLGERRCFHFTVCCQDAKHAKGRRILGGEWEVFSLDVGDAYLRKAADGVWSNTSNVGLNWRDETVRYTPIGQ